LLTRDAPTGLASLSVIPLLVMGRTFFTPNALSIISIWHRQRYSALLGLLRIGENVLKEKSLPVKL
jgi:hypothetical protein